MSCILQAVIVLVFSPRRYALVWNILSIKFIHYRALQAWGEIRLDIPKHTWCVISHYMYRNY